MSDLTAFLRAYASTRAALGFGAALLLLPLAVVVINTGIGPVAAGANTRDIVSGSGTIPLLALASGLGLAASEVQYGSARLAAVAAGRVRTGMACSGALALLAGAAGGCATLLAVALGSVLLDLRGADVPTLATAVQLVLGGTAAALAAGLIGSAAGLAIGRPGAALAGGLLFVLAVEPAVAAAVPDLARYGLGNAIASASAVSPPQDLGQAAGAALAALWALAAAVAAMQVQRRNDL